MFVTAKKSKDTESLDPDFFLTEFNRLQQSFDLLTTENSRCVLPDKAVEKSIQDDVILKPQIIAFKDKTAEADNLLVKLNHRIEHYLDQEGYQSILLNELTKGISELNRLKEERLALHASIVSRQKLLVPDTDCPLELANYLMEARLQFGRGLEKFLFNYSTIHLTNKNDENSVFFRDQLSQFCKELYQELKGKNILTPYKAKAIRENLLQHLGGKTNFFAFKTTTQTLDSIAINSLTANLFTPELTKDPAMLKKQIATIYHVLAKIESLPLQSIKEYDILNTVAVEQDQEIRSRYQTIQRQIDLSLEELGKTLSLFSSEHAKYNQIIEANENRKRLCVLLRKTEEHFCCYDEGRQELLKITSPLTRLEALTDRQSTELNAIKQLEIDLNQSRATSMNCLDKLKKEYSRLKEQMQTDLKDALNNAEAALIFYYDEFLQEPTSKENLEQKFKNQHQLAATLADDNNTGQLYPLQEATEYALNRLRAEIGRCKNTVKDKIANNINCAQLNTSDFHIPALSATNPFKDVLSNQVTQANEAAATMEEIYEQLDAVRGIDLPHWYSNLTNAYLATKNLLTICDTTLQKANIIEQRLNSKEYNVSLTVIDTLKTEIFRIINTHIDRTILKEPGNPELESIKRKPEVCFASSIGCQTIKKIDPRLPTLFRIYKEFYQLNQKYINIDLSFQDKEYYDSLLNNVEKHLHNEHMEEISNGANPQFIQWLRTHILKPLQSISYQAYHYVKQDGTAKYRFFPTLGACKTERQLIEKGNEVYFSLNLSSEFGG
ncbi:MULTISPECIES: hypothetical protein [unclassified Legionella]|uniref:hypothetical protein n=1 Tax=unclassified Legionella TaxID=2622702 RepID=UPI001054E3A3|nr:MULTISPECIES: hypothetical protein [unclassified Legionella]MDI9818137.1 hypothetical protein [Legionella sp. PL877]